MAEDDILKDEPRTNTGKYDESKYSAKRKAFINMARKKGLTSEADMDKAAEIKRAARRAAYAAGKKGALRAIPGVGLAMDLLDPTELGAAETQEQPVSISEINQMEPYRKGGLVHRGQGKVMRYKTTKNY
jgi:hypothetical protein